MKISKKLTRNVISALLLFCMVLQGAVFTQPVAAAAPVIATSLKVESVENPMGIDVAKPRFSWVLESETRGVKQLSYRILVAKSEAALESGAYVWDSNTQNSDDTIDIYYDGPALEPTTRYYWKVQSVTNAGTAVCDTGAYFETGFMDTTMTPWSGAQWITKTPYQTPAWEDIYNYTIEYDFRITNHATGFIFASTGSYYLMWQINIQAGRNNVPADGTPTFRPHRWNTGGASIVDMPMRDDIAVIPNTDAGKAAWYTCRIQVTRTGTQSYVTTSLKPVAGGAFTVIDNNRTLNFRGPIASGNNSWPLGKIGFRQNQSGNEDEQADFTNIKVWNNEQTAAALNSDDNLVFFEDFSEESEMFPGRNATTKAGEHPTTPTYLHVQSAQFTGSRSIMEPASPKDINNEPLFRKSFNTQNKGIKNARLYATARGYYEFSLNGGKVGDQYLAPGWSDYFHTIMYQTYDVTDMLNENGANVIGAMTGKGWYSGPHQMKGSGNYNLYGSVQSLLGKLVITYDDNTEDIIVTDGTWQWNYGPITYADNYRGEGYDARLDREGWNDVGYTDLSDWKAPTIVAAPGPTTVKEGSRPTVNLPAPQIIGQVEPPVREVGRFKDEITEVTPEKYPERLTYNVTQNIAGFITLKVKGEAGAKLTIKHAEMLNTETAYRENGVTVGGGDGPAGTIFRASLRDQYAGGNQVAVDTYILKGDPDGEEWTPRFTFHGFQYFEITGALDKVEILGLEAIAISTDNEMLSSFESSHEKVNKLFSNINWGMLGNQVSVPTDCPNRDERLGYTGDTQMFSRTATYLQNTSAFYSRWLRDMRDYQATQTGNRKGVVPMLIPNNPNEANFSTQWGAGWGDAATIVPWHMYQQYGDVKIIEDSYDSMKDWCDFLYRSGNTTNNLRNATGGIDGIWNLGDWVNMDGTMPDDYKVITNSLFMAHSHNLFAKMARVIGDPHNEADTYEARAKAITEAIKTKYLNVSGYEGKLTHADGSSRRERQTAYAMMLYYNLDEENNHIYAERLSAIVNDNGGRLGTGFVGVAYLTPALSKNGYTDTAYTLLEQEAFPSWIYSINQGATTTWERWDSFTLDKGFDTSGMNSFNHYTFGSVGEWLMSGVLGIERDESAAENAGFHNFILNPQFGGTLNYAKGHYDSVSGRIESDWTWHDNGKFEYAITVPANTTATVYIPSIEEGSPVSEGATPDAANAESVTFLRYDAVNQRAIYKVESGSYDFVSQTKAASKKVEVTVGKVANLYGGLLTAYLEGTDQPQPIVATAANPSVFNVPFESTLILKIEPINKCDFVFDGWTDADGNPLDTGGGAFTVENDGSLAVGPVTDNIGGVRANFKEGVRYDNLLIGSTITTQNEHQNSGAWARANLINGNLIGVSGDNGWSSGDTGSETPTGASRPRITFDMGTMKAINRINLYPRTDAFTADGRSAHFPLRFTIELSNTTDFEDAVTVVDYSNEDYPSLGAGQPAVFDLDDTYTCWYMRITGIKMGTKPADDTVYRMQFKQVGAYYVPEEPEVNKAELNRLIALAEEKAEADYTEDSWVALAEALEAAIGIAEDEDATQEAVDSAAEALQDAIDALKGAIPVASIKINSAATSEVRKNKTLQLGVIYTPADANVGTEITWSSSNEASVKIDAKTGLITGIKAGGSARVTATSANGKTYTITVTVTS